MPPFRELIALILAVIVLGFAVVFVAPEAGQAVHSIAAVQDDTAPVDDLPLSFGDGHDHEGCGPIPGCIVMDLPPVTEMWIAATHEVARPIEPPGLVNVWTPDPLTHIPILRG